MPGGGRGCHDRLAVVLFSSRVSITVGCLSRGGGRWYMWTKHRGVVALRQVVALAELPPEEERAALPEDWGENVPGSGRDHIGGVAGVAERETLGWGEDVLALRSQPRRRCCISLQCTSI